jgi:quercetin dioxygenase-like cupin family protein
MKRMIAPLAATAATIVFAATAAASGWITAKEVGGFAVVADQIGYPPGHVFRADIPPGSSVDTVLVRFPAGADSGWHRHNGLVVVTVTAGTLTLYDPRCERQHVSAGSGFLEAPGVVHDARNEGSALVVLSVTYLGVPPGQPEDDSAPPGFDPCPGIG